MSRSLVSFILLVIVAPTILYSCSDSGANSEIQETEPTNLIGPEGGTVVSDDGLFELIISEGALESSEEITITKLNQENLADNLDLPIVSVYRLDPAGLQFIEPINYELKLPENVISDGENLQVKSFFSWNVSQSGIEPISNQSIELDDDASEHLLKGQLLHFSSIIFTEGYFSFEINYPEKLCIGLEGSIEIELSKSNESEDLFMAEEAPIIEEIGVFGNVLEATEFENSLLGRNETNAVAPLRCRGSGGFRFFDFRVKTVHNDYFINTQYSIYNKFTIQIECVDCTPESPTLISPENNSENIELTPTLQWEAAEGGDWYEVQWVKEGESFDDENVNRALTKDQQWTLDKLDEETEYMWRVRAWKGPEFDEDNSVAGEWSDEWSFTTGKSTETLELGDLTVCVEHGETKSNIFFEWAIRSSFFDNLNDIEVKMVVTLPDGTTADITASPLSVQILLITLEIYTYGNYQYEITEVTFKGEPIDISGEALTGEVNVSSKEQNAGECGE